MHPIVGHRRRLAVFGALWAPVGAALGVLPFWTAGGDLADAWAAAIWGLCFAVPVLASWYVCRSAPLSSAGIARVLISVGAAAFLSASLWTEAGRLWLWAVGTIAPSARLAVSEVRGPAMLGAIAVFLVMIAVHYAIAAADEQQMAVARALEADVAARNAELRALRAQVDPHFLFNCLHSISALVASDPAGARNMCLQLAEFFRDSLRAGAQQWHPLEAEAALVTRYLDIERIRFGDRLRTTIAVSPEAGRAMVPPLLLQPLAENAVRHGVATLVEGCDVSIEARRLGDRIEVAVANPYDADGRRSGSGMGLTNVRARLDSSFNRRAAVEVASTPSVFRVNLSFPFETSV